MIRINLLPYRPERQKRLILEHLSWLFGVILSVSALLFMANVYANSELTDLQDEFSQLRSQNVILMKKIGKIKNLDRLRVDVEKKLALVDTLQEGRFETLSMLNELATVIPANVWLSSVVDNGAQLKFAGFGESNKAVANFMRALDQSPVFGNIALQVIQRQDIGGAPVRGFSMTLNRLIVAKETTGKGK